MSGAPLLTPSFGAGRPLGGARVGLLEGRMESVLADLVRRNGGIPLSAPAVREVPVNATAVLTPLVRGLRLREIEIVVFLTGSGAESLFAAAERAELLGALEAQLAETTILCRGPKPRAVLRRRGLEVALTVDAPFTTAEVLRALDPVPVFGRGVAVVHYGERSAAIPEALAARGARVHDLCVYRWALPEDLTPIERLIALTISGKVDAFAFTSQVQVRHLFEVAGRSGGTLKLLNALNSDIVVAAVGPTCAEALRAAGIEPDVVPEQPKMAPMVTALADRLAAGRPVRIPAG